MGPSGRESPWGSEPPSTAARGAAGASPDRLLRVALADAPIGIALVDPDLRYLFVNDTLAAANGLPPEQHVGKSIFDVLPPEVAAANVPLLQTCFATGRPSQDVEITVPDAGSGEVVWRVSVYPVRLEDRVEAVAGLFVDVSDTKHIEAERERLAANLQQAQRLEAVGRLAAGVAHDLNNLLTIISGASRLGLEAQTGGHANGLFAEIKAASDRAAETTRQLLAVARKRDLRRKPLDLSALVADGAELVRRLVGGEVRVDLRLAPDLPAVRADATEIQHVLLNLAANARDAMPEGGTLTIATEPSELAGTSAVALRVSDTGVGMDETTREQIFEPFFTTKPPGKGTGLGLAAARGTVEQLDGTIAVDSEPEHGTTVEIRLPATSEPPEPQAPQQAADTHGHEAVLIVDDNAPLRTLTGDYLRSLDYRVLLAADAEEAEEVFARERPDILVTDLEMPRTSGRDLAGTLRAGTPELPVVFVSGYARDELREGADVEDEAFIQKPFDLPDLATAIRELLDRHGTSRTRS